MARVLKVWIIDPTDPTIKPKFDTTARHINDGDHDHMKKQAITNLTRDGYTIRALNHGVDGTLIAYVHPAHLKAPDANPVSGWVFKRPEVPPHK